MSAWPPKEGVTTPSISRKDALVSTHASIRVSAPASVAFSAVINTAAYPEWNTAFCPEASIISQPSTAPADDKSHLHKGTVAKFKFNVTDKEASSKDLAKSDGAQCTVSDVSTPENQSDYISADVLGKDAGYTADLTKLYRVAWKQEGSGLKSERFHEFIVISENECEVRTWACYSGMVARGIKWSGSAGKLEAKMKAYVEDIKKHAEQQAKGGGA